MKLLEYKGKELLAECGVRSAPGIVTDNKSYINLSFHKERYKEFFYDHKKVIIKAQIPAIHRKHNGYIIETDDYKESFKLIDKLYNLEYKEQPITTLLIEKMLDVAEEYYLSILHDTRTRQPMILLSREGGIDVENSKKVARIYVSPLEGLHDYQVRELAKAAGFSSNELLQLTSFIKGAYQCFERFDCRICEINPIIRNSEGLLFAGDAKITIDDSGVSRQEIFHDVTDIEEESLLGERALEARKIDYHDHRGVAGKTFIELDGDIAVLASGGGASLTCMDALIEAGGAPANYTEYSGNPSREKVRQLTRITLSKPGLNGCLVIGGTANFTDIYETLSGFVDGLRDSGNPTYPIVVRRAGPRDSEAFTMLKKIAETEGLDLTCFGNEMPMTKAANIIVEKVDKFKQ
ncbi:MAG: ATP-grasp domain-containing protein [Acidobacteriota bacterium]|nr:ATP-grasp domain-containing protein [Acidobacteriota bacterium]